MQAYINFLKKLEQGQVAPVYLFYGEEDYLRRQAVHELTRRLLPGEAAQFNFDLLDGEETSLEQVISLAQAPPFLSSRRLVVVRHAPYFAGRGKKAGAVGMAGTAGADTPAEEEAKEKPEEKAFLAYLQNPAATACLVLETGHPVDQRKKIFKAVQKAGQAIEFAHLKNEDLNRWLLKQAARAQKKMAPGTAELIIGRVGQSMTLLSNELQKLIAYTGENSVITSEDVRQVTPRLVEENIFAVVDALGERRAKRALTGIRDLLAAGEPPPVILAMVARQFRLLLQVKELAAKGDQPAEISKQLGVPPFVAKKISAQSKNFSFAQLEQTLEQLLAFDVAIKSGRQDFYPAMEQLVLSLLAG